jgi:hypothetical protein
MDSDTDLVNELVDKLEELLSITSPLTDYMSPEDHETWQHISARVADLREGELD